LAAGGILPERNTLSNTLTWQYPRLC